MAFFFSKQEELDPARTCNLVLFCSETWMLSSKEQNSQPLSLLIKEILPVVAGTSQDFRFNYFHGCEQ